MEYNGKLYGKLGSKYFDTGKTAKDYDKLEQLPEQILKDLLNEQEEVIQKTFRFNGVSVQKIYEVFDKHGVELPMPF